MKVGKNPTEKVGRKPKLDSSSHRKINFSLAIKKLRKIFSVKSIKNLNRSTKLAITLSVVLVVVGVLAFSLTSTKPTTVNSNEVVDETTLNQTPEIGAVVSLVEGTLQTKDGDGKWQDAPSQLQPNQGAELRTVGVTSRAVISIDDGSILRIDANTEFTFKALSVDRIEIKQTRGYLYARVASSDVRKFIIESKDAQYQATDGAAFKTTYNGDEQSVEVYQGEVQETYTNAKLSQGDKLIVKSEVNPSNDGKTEKLDIEIVKNNPFVLWSKDLDSRNDSYKNSLGFLQDITGPEINITNPLDNGIVLLDPNATEGTVEISGTTEKFARLTVQSKSQADSKAISTTVGNDGKFKTPVLTAPIGNSVFEFIALDPAGNKTTKTIRLTFQRKSQPVISDSITLGVTITPLLVTLDWTYAGTVKAPDGVQVVWDLGSVTKKPKYPAAADTKLEATAQTTTIDITTLTSGETYYFRVCEYDATADTCGLYSNAVMVDIP